MNLVWNVEIVPMAIVYIGIGYILRNNLNLIVNIVKRFYTLLSILILIIIVFTFTYNDIISQDLKSANYGLPLISFLFALLLSVLFGNISYYLTNFTKIKIYFTYLGKASMTIMYLHQPIKFLFLNNIQELNEFFKIILCIIISISFYYLFSILPFTKRYLIGNYKSIDDNKPTLSLN